jgi:hypothetical protein
MEKVNINEVETNVDEVSSSLTPKGDVVKTNGFLRVLKILAFIFLGIICIPLLVLFFLYVVPGIQELGKGRVRIEVNDFEFKKEPAYKKQINQLEKDLLRVTQKLNAFTPVQPYIVISTTNNRFYLYQNKKMIREGFCSSGSYTLLLTEGSQKWIFKTPKGKFRINSKMIDPVWKKPDWAFVEEGLPIPSANDDSRFEYGVLGDYALDIGNGYMIQKISWNACYTRVHSVE